jgi:hypothetical protein
LKGIRKDIKEDIKMDNIKTFKEFLSSPVAVDNTVDEAKQVGIIYHFTKRDNILKLLSKEFMEKELGCDILTFMSHNGYVSTTRNFMFTDDVTSDFNIRTYNIRIALDGDKLSNKYKVKPINGLLDNTKDVFGVDKNHIRVPHKSEKEEVICPINNETRFPLKDYILEIQVYNHDNTRDEEIYNVISRLGVEQHNLNIPVRFVRKWQPFGGYGKFNENCLDSTCYHIEGNIIE